MKKTFNTNKTNSMDLSIGDYFIYEDIAYQVTEKESIGCIAQACDPRERLDHDILFPCMIVDKIEDSPY